MPFLFLLDEANLSPMEHYLSPFLNACDKALDRGARLSLGGDQDLLIPRYTRFLATVNFDHTTEALSSRFLDRSWVITLSPRSIDFDLDESGADLELGPIPAFSYERLMRTFGNTKKDPSQDSSLMDVFRDVAKICSDGGRPISQRSQRMIMRYLSAATPLMDRGTADSRFAPLDYALVQKVLPMLSGPTEDLLDLMQSMADKCADMPMTANKLASMLKMGEESGFVQFFA